jgi:glycosyltransferase involved in cell wall biosynthesis
VESCYHDFSVSTNYVLLITSDVVGEMMAGPGIRSWELARVLSQHFRVTFAVPPLLLRQQPPLKPGLPIDVRLCEREKDLRRLLAEADVILTLGAMIRVYPFLAKIGKPLVIDAYDPFLLAGLQQQSAAPDGKRLAAHEDYRRAHLLALQAADFVLCASEKQRDYWLGMMSALGRINPYTHDEDPTLARLIDVVPFGLPDTPPRHSRKVLKGVHPGIGLEDKLVLWGGGIWDWLDAETAVRAMARLARDRSDVKLFFMGTERPNRTVAAHRAVDETVALSRRLGLLERSVFFNDWVPYGDRESYLLEADVGISLHRDVLESRFAFRTRLMDYLWAGLPTVATGGDVLGEEIGRRGLGKVVPPGDDESTAAALLELLDTPNLKGEYAPRFAAATADYHWDVVAEPLVAFCRNPRLAPDRAYFGKASWPRRTWAAIRGRER